MGETKEVVMTAVFTEKAKKYLKKVLGATVGDDQTVEFIDFGYTQDLSEIHETSESAMEGVREVAGRRGAGPKAARAYTEAMSDIVQRAVVYTSDEIWIIPVDVAGAAFGLRYSLHEELPVIRIPRAQAATRVGETQSEKMYRKTQSAIEVTFLRQGAPQITLNMANVEAWKNLAGRGGG